MGVIKVHTKRVMGLHYESSLGYIYSIGEDSKFILSDTASKAAVCMFNPPDSISLKSLLVDKKNQRLIMADG
jgi:hypothetical protein